MKQLEVGKLYKLKKGWVNINNYGSQYLVFHKEDILATAGHKSCQGEIALCLTELNKTDSGHYGCMFLINNNRTIVHLSREWLVTLILKNGNLTFEELPRAPFDIMFEEIK